MSIINSTEVLVEFLTEVLMYVQMVVLVLYDAKSTPTLNKTHEPGKTPSASPLLLNIRQFPNVMCLGFCRAIICSSLQTRTVHCSDRK